MRNAAAATANKLAELVFYLLFSRFSCQMWHGEMGGCSCFPDDTQLPTNTLPWEPIRHRLAQFFGLFFFFLRLQSRGRLINIVFLCCFYLFSLLMKRVGWEKASGNYLGRGRAHTFRNVGLKFMVLWLMCKHGPVITIGPTSLLLETVICPPRHWSPKWWHPRIPICSTYRHKSAPRQCNKLSVKKRNCIVCLCSPKWRVDGLYMAMKEDTHHFILVISAFAEAPPTVPPSLLTFLRAAVKFCLPLYKSVTEQRGTTGFDFGTNICLRRRGWTCHVCVIVWTIFTDVGRVVKHKDKNILVSHKKKM